MIIQVKNIKKQFESSNFYVENISFDILENDIIGLVGENGSGKSTILKMLNALQRYDSGDILFYGKSIHTFCEKELRTMRKEVAYIFQNANLLENKTVDYHLQLVYKLNKQKVNEKEINEVLFLVNLVHLRYQQCHKLSGGQKQKVAIAMAILQKPKVLLCDEISSALDAKSEKEIFELLLQIKKEKNIAMVIVSHNLTILKQLCDKILLLDQHTIKEVIIPNKKMNEFQSISYVEYVKEYLNA